MSRLAAKEPVICECCGKLARSYCKKRAICHLCWSKEEHILQCSRCGRKINQTSFQFRDLCARCQEKDRRKEKVACSVCGKARTSVLRTRAICTSCWTKEQNDQGICSQCHQQKIIFNKALRCCHTCYHNVHAAHQLRQYAERFTTPFSYRTGSLIFW
jgi:hypothetical protein